MPRLSLLALVALAAPLLVVALAVVAVDLGFGEAHVAAEGDRERSAATGADELARRFAHGVRLVRG